MSRRYDSDNVPLYPVESTSDSSERRPFWKKRSFLIAVGLIVIIVIIVASVVATRNSFWFIAVACAWRRIDRSQLPHPPGGSKEIPGDK